jgi:hypothetical protein
MTPLRYQRSLTGHHRAGAGAASRPRTASDDQAPAGHDLWRPARYPGWPVATRADRSPPAGAGEDGGRSALGGGPDHDHGARCVSDALLTHGSGEQAAEAAVATRADDEQIGSLGPA